jgi:hypothetical protein
LGKIYIFSETIAYTDGENIGFELLFSIDFQMQKILSLPRYDTLCIWREPLASIERLERMTGVNWRERLKD